MMLPTGRIVYPPHPAMGPPSLALQHPYGGPPMHRPTAPCTPPSAASTLGALNVNAQAFQPNAVRHVILPANDALTQYLPGTKKKKENKKKKNEGQEANKEAEKEVKKDDKEVKKDVLEEVCADIASGATGGKLRLKKGGTGLAIDRLKKGGTGLAID